MQGRERRNLWIFDEWNMDVCEVTAYDCGYIGWWTYKTESHLNLGVDIFESREEAVKLAISELHKKRINISNAIERLLNK